MDDNKSFFSEPIIKKFFSSSTRYEMLLKRVIEDKDEKANEILNKAFMEFFYKYRLISYFSKLSYSFSIEFDKKQRKKRERYLLILDNPNKRPLHITHYNEDFTGTINYNNFYENFSNQNLANAFKNLTSRQIKVLELFFVHNLKQYEIAGIMDVTPQSISKSIKTSLTKIKLHLEKGANEN